MDTSYLSQQVTTIIERLHGFFDEIGVPSHERDARESELFAALSDTLHQQLNQVAKEKHELTETAQKLIKSIRQMERSLDDDPSEEETLKVTHPLLDCIQSLKEKHHLISRQHRERFEQVRKLAEALESYAAHLEPGFVQINLPPATSGNKIPTTFDLSPGYVTKLDAEFTRVYEEYNRRVAAVSQTASEIINLWSELGTPQAQVDSNIVQCAHSSPEQLGLHNEDLTRLCTKRDRLLAEKASRERKLSDLTQSVSSLWTRLGVDETHQKTFLCQNRGFGIRQINEFEDELSRLNELKRQNLHLFVEDARFKLQSLWDELYFSEEEMLDFTPAFSHEYTDALLSAHEKEIERLEALKAQRAPILAAVEKHRSLIQDREELEKSSQDASRLLAKGQKGERRDPGKLLREEKMRKRIAKELPKVEGELRRILENWEEEYGRPFCVLGRRYLDELEACPPRGKTPVRTESLRAQSRAGTVRGKTPQGKVVRPVSTLNSSVMNSSVMGKTSPTKGPASRLPMSTLRDGQNSPERTQSLRHKASRSEDLSSTIRGAGRAPPSQLRNLFTPPPAAALPGLGRSGSVVRQVEPEDVFERKGVMGPPPRPNYHRAVVSHDSLKEGYMTSRGYTPQYTPKGYVPQSYTPQSYAPSTDSRAPSATSNGSAVGSAIAGSENWETFTDGSDEEQEDFRATVKRPATSAGVMTGGREFSVRSGAAESEWTDDDVGDTY
ncbi:hypothetical protein K470DRAFT_226918 [Piedraia hortae CBS 480.64]|uniref:Microtubule associated protein n=1 Tax=Piedraia hortae CBS 480.64 TaxID=1314780 RepID=A0A6A7C7D2_9PEZI|nr:hypothetical protein K470DRAFT_226918 [Piedraia hortae CBS 480.64]